MFGRYIGVPVKEAKPEEPTKYIWFCEKCKCHYTHDTSTNCIECKTENKLARRSTRQDGSL